MDNELDNIIVLNDENGNDEQFELLDLIAYRDEEYVVLLPVEDSDEPGEVVILKLVSSEDDETEEYVALMMTKPSKLSLKFSKQNSQMNLISSIKTVYNFKLPSGGFYFSKPL